MVRHHPAAAWVVALAVVSASTVGAVAPDTARATPTATSPAFVPGGTYVPVTPTRVLDTRSGLGGPRGATTSLHVPVVGAAGVPTTGAGAVVLNVTVTAPVGAGYLTASPTGTVTTSNVNFRAGQTVAQLVTTKLGATGGVELRASARTQVVVDLVGWFTDREHVAAGDGYRTTTDRRVLDSRRTGGPLRAGVTRRIALTGVPTGTVAAMVDVTAVRPASAVYVTAWGSGARPSTSTVNAVRGEVRSNRAIVPVAADGSISLFADGRTDVVVDLNGWFTGGAGGAYFVATDPLRITDTRRNLNFHGVGYGGEVNGAFEVAGKQDLPPSTSVFSPVAAWLTTTVVNGTWSGWVGFDAALHSTGAGQPLAVTSDVNFGPGVTSNAVVSRLGDNGSVARTGWAGSSAGPYPNDDVGLVVDVSGFFATAVPQPQVGMWAVGSAYGNGPVLGPLWDRPVPGFDGDVVQVDATANFTFARYRDGTVLEQTTEGSSRVLDHDAVDIATSFDGQFTVKADGSVWGDDPETGMLGQPGEIGRYGRVAGVTDAVSVSVSDYDAYGAWAVRRDGSVVAWGRDETFAATPLPGFGSGIVSLDATGSAGVCVAHADGSVGFGSQLPDDPSRGGALPVPTLAGVGAVRVVAQNRQGCWAVDTQHRLHKVDFRDKVGPLPAPTDLVVGSPGVAQLLRPDGPAARLDGVVSSTLRILGTDGHVYDRVGETWSPVEGFSGVTLIGGRYETVMWVPPTG